MDTVKTTPAYAIYKMGKLLDQSIQELDPLGFDQFFITGDFALAATALSPNLILAFNESHVNKVSFEDVLSMSEVSAMAAARDLNMVASVITRFGIQMHEMPHLESLLLLLSEKTREIPTDTVFGYGSRNPLGQRQRSFTNTDEERLFIRSFTDGMNNLIISLAALEMVQNMSITNARYAPYIREASRGFHKMSEAILNVRKHISPDFFTQALRPFFDPKTIRGKTYFAAGGAQMPVTIIDLILWGIEDNERVYVGYRNENFRYLPQFYQGKIESVFGKSSIRLSLNEEFKQDNLLVGRENATASLSALQEFVSQIIKFRAPHLAVAKANMRIRSLGAVGSGGYDLFILEHLIKKTKEFKAHLVALETKITQSPL